jgi:hypothetical protein
MRLQCEYVTLGPKTRTTRAATVAAQEINISLGQIFYPRLMAYVWLGHWLLGVVNCLTGLLTPSLLPSASIESTV